jgi:hypothetical protein
MDDFGGQCISGAAETARASRTRIVSYKLKFCVMIEGLILGLLMLDVEWFYGVRQKEGGGS